MQSQEIIEQMECDALDSFSTETFSQADLRFQAQFYDTKIAETLIRNMLTHNLGLSKAFTDGITYWLNVWGHPIVPTANMTNREREFALRARLALYNTPCKRTDLDNPHYLNILRLCEDQYHLAASNATGQRRLGIRILEKNTRISAVDETEQHRTNRRRGRNDE